MSDLGTKTTQVVSFSSKEEDYWKWSWTFLASARGKKYKDVLFGKEAVPPQNKVLVERQTKES